MSESSTPHALLQSDVVALIARECEPAVLSRLARTSRFHSELALDALWRDLTTHTVLRFVKLIPESCFQPPQPPSTTEWKIWHELQSEDWERFRFYSERVHTWTLDKERGVKTLRPAVYTLLASRAAAGPSPLFPRLKSLVVIDGTSTSLEMSRLGVSPILEEFDCRSRAALPPSESWLAVFPTVLSSLVDLPDLRSLKIVVGQGELDAVGSLLNTAKRLQCLRLDFMSDFQFTESLFEKAAMPYLQDLSLSWEGLVQVDRVLNALQRTSKTFKNSLTTLRLLLTGRTRHPLVFGVQDVHHILREYAFAPQLYSLKVADVLSRVNLLHCRTLMLQTVAPLEITDQELHDLTATAPSLRVLWLNPSPLGITEEDIPSLSYRSIISISHNSRRLKTLGLFLDLRHMPLSIADNVETPLPSLKGLTVGSSYVSQTASEHPIIIAKFLCKIFPDLPVGGLRWSRDAMIGWNERCPCCRFSPIWSQIRHQLGVELEQETVLTY